MAGAQPASEPYVRYRTIYLSQSQTVFGFFTKVQGSIPLGIFDSFVLTVFDSLCVIYSEI